MFNESKPIIFIIDDQILMLEAIRDVLEKENCYDVYAFSNSLDLLAHDLLSKVDLFVIDVRLAESCDGLDLYDEICSKNVDSPVLFISGYTTNRDKMLNKMKDDNVICDFMEKPFPSIKIFTNRVNLLLKVSKQHKSSLCEQRAIEKEKERINRLFEAVLEQIPLGIDIVERNGNWKLVKSSRKSREITGDDELECTSSTNTNRCSFKVLDLDGNVIPHRKLPAIRSFLYDEHINNEELIIQRADGTEVYVAFKSVPVKDDDGNTIAALQISYDITDNKMKENAIAYQQKVLRGELEKRILNWKTELNRSDQKTKKRLDTLQDVLKAKIQNLNNGVEVEYGNVL